jgi:hypothetical protein
MELGMATLSDVVYLLTGRFNLFSLTKMAQAGWILGGDPEEIWLTKESHHLSFDNVIPTPKGVLFAMYIQRDMEIAGATADAGPIMSTQQVHDHLAHPGEENARKWHRNLVGRSRKDH